MNVYAPVKGTVKKLEDVNDEVFAQKMLGEGVSIIASSKEVLAPITGVISAIFPTNHAIGITSDEGVEVLIHIGIDTVEMEGEGFIGYVKLGDHVNQKDKLVDVDFDLIHKKGYDGDVLVIITNSSEYANIQITKGENVETGDVLMMISRGV